MEWALAKKNHEMENFDSVFVGMFQPGIEAFACVDLWSLKNCLSTGMLLSSNRS